MEESTSFWQKIVAGAMDFLQSVTVALALFSVVYLFLFQPSIVKGASMQPNLHTDEKLLTDKVSYQFSAPARGDIVILRSPINPDIELVKRLIGLPGEEIVVQNGRVLINGHLLNEPYVSSPTSAAIGNFLTEGQAYQIPQGSYFVLGDNRANSSDSRTFGPVPRQNIIGKAVFRYWPTGEFGLLPHPNY